MGLHPVILAGGSGTRMWPLSRELYPKQFLPLVTERSMLQETLLRLDGIEGLEPAVVVCNEEHRFLVAEHARQLGKALASIVLEPQGRNTAPALALAALSLAGYGDPVMLVTPADHVIRDSQAFQNAVRRGIALASEGCLVTFGIVPTGPETGYGYIKRGEAFQSQGASGLGRAPFTIAAFVEKPDEPTARRMLETEDYFWNSGIFMMKVSVWLEQLGIHRPDIAEVCKAAHAAGGRDGDFFRPDKKLFLDCPGDSIDYAVMERVAGKNGSAPPCVVVPLDAGWSDLGAWSSLWEEGDKDADGNVVRGDVYAHLMRNSLLISSHRLLAAVGLEDVIVVETADAVLVAHKDSVQDVKALVARLKTEARTEQENHRKVHRPWGSFETVDIGPRFQVKRLTVNPGAALSLQMHHHRAEHWVVVKGTAKVSRGNETFLLTENQSTYVSVGTPHRLENPGSIPLELIEVQSGSYLGEDDIVRFEDRYNRA
ncbi:MAG: mannose-1-phosphate guanylyltransferase/mannose-6-phosphate isomerase [Chloroflexi bacterium]|nr:mannose-1-phosphate guanylyltransferase/mannose-6-phosphate isomerase [Chloroflexota bacterium]